MIVNKTKISIIIIVILLLFCVLKNKEYYSGFYDPHIQRFMKSLITAQFNLNKSENTSTDQNPNVTTAGPDYSHYHKNLMKEPSHGYLL